MNLHYLLFFIFVLNFTYSQATTCTSQANGNWSTAATWSCGAVPGCGDTIIIKHSVTLTANVDLTGCGSPTYIVIKSGGNLHFNNGKKLKLPCGSGVTLEAGPPAGTITANGYTGNSESLQICGAVAWQAADGAQSGPIVFGSGLPIELLYFDAYLQNEQVNIEWATLSETNNNYFIIQRSIDGVNWTDIITTDGAGNSNQLIEYFEIDYSPLSGTSYYRLMQVDINGSSSYSNVVVIKTYNELAKELHLFPNPCDGAFHLQLNGFGDQEILVVVRNLIGDEVYTKVIITSTNGHIEAVDLEGKLAAGTYIVTASSINELYSQKLVVK